MIATRAMLHGRHAAIVVLACVVAGPAGAEMVNRIVATVDGDPITAHEVRRYGEERHARGVSEKDLLEAVITDKILEKEIAARKITIKADAVDRYVAEVMSRNKMTEEQFKAALKQQGLSFEQYRARIKTEIEKTQLLGQEMRMGEVTVGDDEVQRYYDEHKSDFSERTSVTVRDIFFGFQAEMTRQDAVRLMEQAKAVKQMADSGQPFEQLARRYSQGPGAENGGLLGSFRKGEMAPALEQAAFALAPGEVSSPIVTPTGVHLLKVDAVRADGDRVDFEQVKGAIRQALVTQAENARFREWISKNLRERHHVEVLN